MGLRPKGVRLAWVVLLLTTALVCAIQAQKPTNKPAPKPARPARPRGKPRRPQEDAIRETPAMPIDPEEEKAELARIIIIRRGSRRDANQRRRNGLDPVVVTAANADGPRRNPSIHTRHPMKGKELAVTSIFPMSGPNTGGTSVTVTGGPFASSFQYECEFGSVRVPVVSLDVDRVVCLSPALLASSNPPPSPSVPLRVCFKDRKCSLQKDAPTFTYDSRIPPLHRKLSIPNRDAVDPPLAPPANP